MGKRKRTGEARVASRRPRTETRRRQRSRVGIRTLWGSAFGLAVLAGFIGTRDAAASHPTPRAEAHAHHVAPASRYSNYARVAAIYGQAGEIKGVLDGIYCYCRCSQHSRHYSLLDCFRDDHAARCDICLSEATLAHKLNAEGKSLDEIRDAVDGLYGN